MANANIDALEAGSLRLNTVFLFRVILQFISGT